MQQFINLSIYQIPAVVIRLYLNIKTQSKLHKMANQLIIIIIIYSVVEYETVS